MDSVNYIKALKEKKETLDSWLIDLKKRNEQAPDVQRSAEVVGFQIDLIESMPKELPKEAKENLANQFSFTTNYWQKTLPLPQQSPLYNPASGYAMEVSSSNTAYQALSSISCEPKANEPVSSWIKDKAISYQKIQERHQRREAIAGKLTRLFPDRCEEFQKACDTYQKCIAGFESQTAFGINARNLLEHLKGDLFSVAMRRLRVQKVKWDQFAKAMAKGGPDSQECVSLMAEEKTYKHLHVTLTNLAKNLVTVTEANLRSHMTEYHDHIFAVISLVDENLLASK